MRYYKVGFYLLIVFLALFLGRQLLGLYFTDREIINLQSTLIQGEQIQYDLEEFKEKTGFYPNALEDLTHSKGPSKFFYKEWNYTTDEHSAIFVLSKFTGNGRESLIFTSDSPEGKFWFVDEEDGANNKEVSEVLNELKK